MKKILLFLMALWAFNASAQDVIVKKDGSTILSKVLKITTTEVEYKKFTNQNGPTYTIPKTEIQAINYENGEKETFGEVKEAVGQQAKQKKGTQHIQPVDSRSLNSQGVSDKELMIIGGEAAKIKKIKNIGWTIGGILVPTGVGLIVWQISWGTKEGIIENNTGLSYLLGTVCIAGGITSTAVCLSRAKKMERQTMYTIYTAPIYQQDFALHNGSSLSTGVDVLSDSRLHTQTVGLGLRYNF